MTDKCYLCGKTTDFTCNKCDDFVCEKCCVVPTYMNQIDYALCLECGDSREAEITRDQERRWKIEKEKKDKKEERAKVRKISYWKPVSVAKRKAKRAALLDARREAEKEKIEAVSRIFASWRF